ncbi:Ig-like domain-containing protein, partial [Rhodococcus sp. IEGM 1379]|uniref:Ig-like domain-containing protein n=1 Tax=Rhodococcus sp. IEGM 1379 TaxID=3047086 RepID=UPI0024B874A7
ATLSHTFDTVAAHSITAEFVAGAGFAGSTSTPSTVVVSDPIPSDTETTTTVTESATAVAGTPVVLSANVSPAPTGGDVKFLVDNVVVGSGQVGTDGVATLSHTFTAAGTPNVVAQFVGTTGFAASTSAQFSVTVTAATPTDVETTTTLDTIGALDTNTPVVLKATVNPTTANGKVQFKVGNTLIGAPVDVVNGVATLTHTFTGAGTFNVTAEFIGADGFADSAATPKTANVTDATDPGTPGGTGSLGSLSGIFGS